MLFDVAGPFDLERFGTKKLLSSKATPKALRQKLEEWQEGLSDACGCYLFALRAGKGFTPYYVGQASKRSILAESLNPSNISKYNEIESAGTPVIFILPMLTPAGKFRKATQAKGGIAALDFLERWLITVAIEKNVNLINNKQTFFLRNIHVTGIFNARKGEASLASQCLTKALR